MTTIVVITLVSIYVSVALFIGMGVGILMGTAKTRVSTFTAITTILLWPIGVLKMLLGLFFKR